MSSSSAAGAADIATSLPHTFWLGAASVPTSARDIDANGSRRAAALPAPEAAHVAWQRRLTAGASGNVVVDADGRIFVPGLRRVTELASDGSLRHELEGPFSIAVAAAMLADGTRAVLTRDGDVLGWNEGGRLIFRSELPAPAPTASSVLLPLPDGQLLVAIDRWIFAFDASRGAPVHVTLPSPVALVRRVGERTLIIDDRGQVLEWQRGAGLQSLGALSATAVAALGDGALLVALTSARTLELFDPNDGRLQQLTRFDAPGPLPLLALSEPGRWVTLGSRGDWAVLGAIMPAPSPGATARREGPPVNARDAELLADDRGVVAHWAANRPLMLGSSVGAERELPEVRCSDPVGLAPAGPGRMVAVCGSGAIWMIESADRDAAKDATMDR